MYKERKIFTAARGSNNPTQFIWTKLTTSEMHMTEMLIKDEQRNLEFTIILKMMGFPWYTPFVKNKMTKDELRNMLDGLIETANKWDSEHT